MSPDQLSAKGTEHGAQAALFAWAAMAQRYGFLLADCMDAYSADGMKNYPERSLDRPLPELEWLHAIPNGGKRDARTAALLKAEGLRSGVADVFLPVPRIAPSGYVSYCGLYIEMKKPKGGVQSPEQKAFEAHCNANHYVYRLCKSWREAADTIKDYLQ